MIDKRKIIVLFEDIILKLQNVRYIQANFSGGNKQLPATANIQGIVSKIAPVEQDIIVSIVDLNNRLSMPYSTL